MMSTGGLFVRTLPRGGTDPSFVPGPVSVFDTMALQGSRVVILQRVEGTLVRLNPDGDIDRSFAMATLPVH